ncbi:hypothetical protein [Streptomyces sp. NPDC001980]|uniref:hypothetical protein n=1 Tax=Streptomyces sp. NPDC001980 TaxID=3157126 RepID=UPI00332EA352
MTTIRDATPSDADDIYRLLSGFVTSYRPDRAVFDDATFPRIVEAASAGSAEFLVAEQDSCRRNGPDGSPRRRTHPTGKGSPGTHARR